MLEICQTCEEHAKSVKIYQKHVKNKLQTHVKYAKEIKSTPAIVKICQIRRKHIEKYKICQSYVVKVRQILRKVPKYSKGFEKLSKNVKNMLVMSENDMHVNNYNSKDNQRVVKDSQK